MDSKKGTSSKQKV